MSDLKRTPDDMYLDVLYAIGDLKKHYRVIFSGTDDVNKIRGANPSSAMYGARLGWKSFQDILADAIKNGDVKELELETNLSDERVKALYVLTENGKKKIAKHKPRATGRYRKNNIRYKF